MKKNSKNEEETRQQQNLEGKNGFPDPIKEKCFKCKNNFWIKFVVPQQNYSRKNNWNYWTGELSNKKICNACLRKFYLEDKLNYLSTIKDSKKRKILGSYVSSNFV